MSTTEVKKTRKAPVKKQRFFLTEWQPFTNGKGHFMQVIIVQPRPTKDAENLYAGLFLSHRKENNTVYVYDELADIKSDLDEGTYTRHNMMAEGVVAVEGEKPEDIAKRPEFAPVIEYIKAHLDIALLSLPISI